MARKAKVYIMKMFIQRLLGLLFYLFGAGWTMHLRSLLYFALYFAAAGVSAAVLYRANPETLAERNKWNTNAPGWDKLLLAVFWPLTFFIIYFVAGTEATKAPGIGVVFSAGIALQLLAAALSLWALLANTFLESTARIQTDRAQVVCKTGPYRIVRHPAYAAILLWCLSMPMVFGTLLVGVTAAVIAVIIVARTFLEDKMLREQLAGYYDYMQEVRYRVVPFVW